MVCFTADQYISTTVLLLRSTLWLLCYLAVGVFRAAVLWLRSQHVCAVQPDAPCGKEEQCSLSQPVAAHRRPLQHLLWSFPLPLQCKRAPSPSSLPFFLSNTLLVYKEQQMLILQHQENKIKVQVIYVSFLKRGISVCISHTSLCHSY